MGFPVLLVGMVWCFFAAFDLWWQAHPDMRNISTGYDIIDEAARGYEVPPALENYQAEEFSTAHAVAAGNHGVLNYGPYATLVALAWFIIAYFGHGALMRMASHSHPITRAQMPRIYNLLENLCISRGLKMPQFEIIDSPALNAFATGINESSYRIVLTRGIIERLSDDELEAVIAHELTHIINCDARLLVIAVIFVGMISFFAEMFYRSLVYGRRPNYYVRRDDNRRGGAVLVSMLIALAILMIGYMFAVVIRFALSRKREFLADAGAVELTKNPEGMMRALQRIAGNDTVTGMPDEIQQMCIENSHNFMFMFATHPPIGERIKAISLITNTPVPDSRVSLRRGPSEPWDGGKPPETPHPLGGKGPWGGQGPL